MRNSSRWSSRHFLIALCAAAITPAMAHADPAISGFSSDHVPLGSFLMIYGSGFGNAQGQGYVLMASRQVPVMAWSPVAISVYVNPMAFDHQPVVLDAVYPVQVVVPSADHPNSNLVNLTITSAPPPVYSPSVVDQSTRSDQPSVTGFQATTFCPGSTVAIFGAGFGDAQGSGYVSVTASFLDAQGNPFTQEVAIPVLAWSENAIEALLSLPAGAQFGSYTLTVHRGNGKTAAGSFTVGSCD
jgi:hypothetical protein